MPSYSNTKPLTLKYLWNSASNLKSSHLNNPSSLAVVNQLREKSIALVRDKNVDSSGLFVQSEVCMSCGNPRSEGDFKFRISSHKYKIRKLKKKLQMNSQNLTPYNKQLLSFYSKRKDNVMVRKCLICMKKTKIGLNKPATNKGNESRVSEVSESSFIGIKKKKRKSKKNNDSFSGLIPSAVLSARQSLRESNDSCVSFNKISISSETSCNENSYISNNIQSLDTNCQREVPCEAAFEKTKGLEKVKPTQNLSSNKKNRKKKNKSFVSEFLSLL